jgi:hypothetical protein
MTFTPSIVITKDDVIRAAAPFEFSAYIDEHYWREDGADLARIVQNLSNDIRSVGPVVQPRGDTEGDKIGLTPKEYEYSANFWRHWHRSPIITAMTQQGWSLRRIHIELVDMLRALIALDPDRLQEFDVIDTADIVLHVESGRTEAADAIESELARLTRDETDGHMLRLGMYLALRMKEGEAAIGELAARLLDDLGAIDTMERPDYPTDGKSAKFTAEIEARRRRGEGTPR